jgi:hypothetical protein
MLDALTDKGSAAATLLLCRASTTTRRAGTTGAKMGRCERECASFRARPVLLPFPAFTCSPVVNFTDMGGFGTAAGDSLR